MPRVSMVQPSSLLPAADSISSLINEDTEMEHAFRIIDQEVEKHKNYIVALWKRRNIFAPISRLPPEVLCKIFAFASQSDERYEARLGSSLHWIKVSYVCHEWRNVAVNSPSLWTNLPVINARWTEEMLSRSKMASLTVDANFSLSVEAISSALRHASRIQHLNLSHIDAGMIQTLLSNLPRSAPRLESLCIQTHSLRTPNFEGYCELPGNILCEMDRLRRLEVSRCKINWDSHLFSSLTFLKIHDTPLASRPTSTQLWNAMKRMPHLESIDLQDSLPMADDSVQPHETIFLAHLQRLTIISSSHEVQLFLKGISFLPTVIITVACKAVASGEPDFTGALSVISSTISPSAKSRRKNIRTFEVLPPAPGLDGLRFRAYTDVASDIDAEDGDMVPSLELSLSFRTAAVTNTRDKILMDACAAIPLGNLIRLHLKSSIRFTSGTLAEAFGTLPHLRSVYTTGVCANRFTQALQEIRSNQNLTTLRNPGVFFPSLRSISMYDVNFDDGEVTIGALQDCLIWRYECGVEVRDLKLEECSRITEDDVDLLRDIIVDLEWDGLELGFSDDDEEDYDDIEYDEDYDSDEDDYYGDEFNSYPVFW